MPPPTRTPSLQDLDIELNNPEYKIPTTSSRHKTSHLSGTVNANNTEPQRNHAPLHEPARKNKTQHIFNDQNKLDLELSILNPSHQPAAHAPADWAPRVGSPQRAAHAPCSASRSARQTFPPELTSWTDLPVLLTLDPAPVPPSMHTKEAPVKLKIIRRSAPRRVTWTTAECSSAWLRPRRAKLSRNEIGRDEEETPLNLSTRKPYRLPPLLSTLFIHAFEYSLILSVQWLRGLGISHAVCSWFSVRFVLEWPMGSCKLFALRLNLGFQNLIDLLGLGSVSVY